MFQPKTIYAQLAFETIVQYIKHNNITDPHKWLQIKELQDKAACFVSLHTNDGELRGCIGTIQPVEDSLCEEIIRNAISACSHDPRFPKVKPHEINDLTLSVDVLSKPEKVKSIEELDEKKYGVIVSDNNFRRAVLLPDLEGIKNVEHQLQIVTRKAGINHTNFNLLNIERFTVQRFH